MSIIYITHCHILLVSHIYETNGNKTISFTIISIVSKIITFWGINLTKEVQGIDKKL